MRHPIQSLFYSAITASIFTLAGCGGQDGAANQNYGVDHEVVSNTSNPVFSWSKVTQSSNYSPSGDITTTTPTFEWIEVPNATDYVFGHESTYDESVWMSYEVSSKDANCQAELPCSYTPNDFTFEIGDQKAWWVKAKVAGVWQSWSAPSVFTVINTGQSGRTSAIAPSGEIKTTKPSFTWEPRPNATKYRLGYDNTITVDDWTSFTLAADEVCPSATQNCTFKTDESINVNDNKTWWVQAFISGAWENWSDGLNFTVLEDDNNSNSVTAISPSSKVATDTPELTWRKLDEATNYRIGYAITGDSNWYLIDVKDKTGHNCTTTTCSYVFSNNEKLSANDQVSWWVRPEINNAWDQWSNGLKFSVSPLVGGKTPQTISFDALSNLTFESQQITIQPLVSSASSGLAVNYLVVSPVNCGITGSTVFAKQPGICTITATQTGNSLFDAATPVTQSFAINNKALDTQTINFANLTNTVFKPSQAVLNTVQATATSGLMVSYDVTTPTVCGMTGNSVFANSTGTCSITVSQSGNNDYQAANPVAQSFIITKASQSYVGVTRTNGPNTDAEVGQTILLELMTDQTSQGTTLPLVLTLQTPDICALNNGLLTGSEDGICKVTVTRAGDNNYLDYSTNYEIEILNTSNVLLKILSNNVTAITTSSATIEWTLNEVADGQVEYGVANLYGSVTAKDTNLKLAHSQSITALQSDTVYHYRVTSVDQDGEIVTSADQTFKTRKVTPPNPTVKRILPLGDSITHGAGYNFANPAHSSYRDELYDLLNAAQFEFEYVGTGSSIYTLGNGNTVELKHEGHPSWRADAIDANLNDWLASYGVPVDIALVHAGTNDILQNQGADTDTLNDIENIISKLQASNRSITILIAQIIPIETPDASVGLNALLTNAWAVSQSTNTSKVSIIDHHTGFTTSDLYTDLIHPTASGEIKMAQTWFEAITNTTPPSNDPVLPIQDAALTLWLDASDADADGNTDITMANTASVTWAWKDKSGKGNDVKTISTSQPPTQVANGLKSKPVFDFATTGLATSIPDQITPNTSYTKFVVFKLDDIYTENNLVSTDTTALWGGFTNNLHAWHNYADYISPRTPAQGLSIADSSVGTISYNIASTRYGNPDNISNILSLNSILQNSNQVNTPFFSSVTYIGSIGSDYYLDGQIAEAIIFDRALSDAEILLVEDYLRAKWF